MVDAAIDGSERHGLLWDDPAPFAERLIGGDAGLGLILADRGDIVEDQQAILFEPGDGAFEREFPSRHLQPLNKIGGAHEQDAPTVFDERQPHGGGEMALAGPVRAEQQEIGAFPDPAIAGAKRHDLRLADRGKNQALAQNPLRKFGLRRPKRLKEVGDAHPDKKFRLFFPDEKRSAASRRRPPPHAQS
jgi:hypothetical protein